MCHRIELFIRYGLLACDHLDIRSSSSDRCLVPLPDDLVFLYLDFGFLPYPSHLPLLSKWASGFMIQLLEKPSFGCSLS